MKLKINLSIEKDLIEKLDRLAEKNRRSRSNMLEVLLIESFEVEDAISRVDEDAKK